LKHKFRFLLVNEVSEGIENLCNERSGKQRFNEDTYYAVQFFITILKYDAPKVCFLNFRYWTLQGWLMFPGNLSRKIEIKLEFPP